MKSGNLFTYLLYALLGLLICVAGYLVLERRKEAKLKEEERKRDELELQQTMQNLGMNTGDSITSSYVGESTSPKPKADKNGIEEDPTPSTKQPATTTAKPAAPTASTAKPAATPAPATSNSKQLVSKGAATTPKSVAPSNTGRYQVVVGAFSQVENARAEMEKLVKMGYRDAEVIKYKTNMWRVLAKRTSNKSEAERLETDLERTGQDAMVVDGYKK